MKLTYLGTAAAEGFPAVFCRCKYCIEARRLGGKNVRTRSQSMINGDMLIDFGPDTYMHLLTRGIEGDAIKYLLVTHPHEDHFYPLELFNRASPYAHEMRAPTLTVVCGADTRAMVEGQPKNVEFKIISAYETVTVGEYEITALPARHMREGNTPLFYLIKGDKTLLYAHDTGYFFDEVFDFLVENKIRVHAISLDCTYVTNIVGDTDGHMGLENNARLLARLRELGIVDGETVCYVNHFSHNGNPLHERIVPIARELGFEVSYDGCEVEF